MAKIKNISGQDLRVPWLGDQLVPRGKTVDVPASDVTAYTQQERTWRPADDEAKALHDEMLQAIAYLQAVAEAGLKPTEDDVDAIVAQLLADTPARDLVKAIKANEDLHQAQVLLDLERAAERPRSTVIAAAEKRVEDLSPDDGDDGDGGDGDDNNDDEEH